MTITLPSNVLTTPPGMTDLDFLRTANSWQLHAGFYEQSADKLVDAALADLAAFRRGDYLLPVAFLYRHYLELMLKGVIHGGIALGKVQKTKNLEELLEDHNLHKLWNKAKPVVDDVFGPEKQKEIKACERLVLDYHAVDESSCTFRYPYKKDGSDFLTNLPSNNKLASHLKAMNVSKIRDDLNAVHDLLDDAVSALNAEFDSIQLAIMP